MVFGTVESWPSTIVTAMTTASCVVLLLAACHDVIARTVPNWMSVVLAGFGLVVGFINQRLLFSVAFGVVVFAAAAFCWRRGWMGGADVKLLGAIAIVLPPPQVATFAVAMSIAGGVHAAIYLAARRVVTPPHRPRPHSLLLRGLRAEQWRISHGGPLPYACAIAFGFFFAVFKGATP
jgi:prepilin peptidase CpaA